MIGRLPTSIKIGGKNFKIRSDYRDCLTIISAFQDPDLSLEEQFQVLLEIMYPQHEEISRDDVKEALEKGVSFLNCDKKEESRKIEKPVYDWEQDEQIIFSAINKVAQKEVRAVEYMHWWTFLGYFNEIGQGTFSTIVSIRDKLNRGKKLDDWEKDFLKDNKSLVELKKRRSKQEQELIDKLNAMYS